MISIIRTPTIIIMLVANYLKLVKLCIGYVQQPKVELLFTATDALNSKSVSLVFLCWIFCCNEVSNVTWCNVLDLMTILTDSVIADVSDLLPLVSDLMVLSLPQKTKTHILNVADGTRYFCFIFLCFTYKYYNSV